MELTGKVVFITGAAQGLGKGYSTAMLEKGAKVFFADFDPTTGEKTAKEFRERFGAANVRFAPLDVTDLEKFTDVFNQAVSELGHVDIMVNNAGLLNESRWKDMILINVMAVMHGTKLATEHMRKDKGGPGGRIINISSIVGLIDVPFMPAYAGTKHAVRSFTSSLALQSNLSVQGIEYGILCPDAADTDMVNKLDNDKIPNLHEIKEILEQAKLSVPQVVSAFMELLQLEKMNGVILHVQKSGTFRRKLEMTTVTPEST